MPRKLNLRKTRRKSNIVFPIQEVPFRFYQDGIFCFFEWMKYLIAGLGNIGPEYELTRHNIGFLVLDRMADNHKIDFTTQRLADKAEFKFKGKQIHLIKPNTYMNLSGKAIAYWLQELKIPKENLLVIVDDLALPFGSLRMRTKGSAAGHNGLKNIEQLLIKKRVARGNP
jgi:peptidyl-tRNA hydrolase, PTH1 family